MEWQDWVNQARDYFRSSWGLTTTFGGQAAMLYLYLSAYGLNPRITSGYRDPKKQADMRRRWDAGDRAGMKFRPAANSDHCKGKAVDIVTNNPKLAAQIAKALNLGAGADYGDDVHFFAKG